MPQVNTTAVLPWGRVCEEEGEAPTAAQQEADASSVQGEQFDDEKSPDSKKRRVDGNVNAGTAVQSDEEQEYEDEVGPGLKLAEVGLHVGQRIEVKPGRPENSPRAEFYLMTIVFFSRGRAP
jgi:hypothetical protein